MNLSDFLYKVALSIIDMKNTPLRTFGSEFREFMKDYKGSKVLLIRPGGNNGDELIYMGMRKLLEDMSIHYWEVCPTDFPVKIYSKLLIFPRGYKKYYLPFEPIRIPKDIELIIIHGGANFNDIWFRSIRIVKHLIGTQKIPVVVAPQTYYFYRTYLPDIFLKSQTQVYLFAREMLSYKHLLRFKLPEFVHVAHSDDTALYLTAHDFDVTLDKKHVLLAFRTDKERLTNTRGTLSKELFKMFDESGYPTIVSDVSVNETFSHFINLVSNASLVITDRLHVSILGSILKKPVILLSGSYFKNFAVYQYSLRYFTATKFINK